MAEFVRAFTLCASPERDVRDEGERILQEGSTQPGFILNLLHFVMNASFDFQLRVAGAIYAKNLIHRHWIFLRASNKEEKPLFSQEEQVVIRENIIEAVVNSGPALAKHLSEAARWTTERSTIPTSWAPKIAQYLQSTSADVVLSTVIFLNSLCRKYEYKVKDERQDYDALILLCLPHLYSVVTHTAQNPTPENLNIMRLVVKIYCRSVRTDIEQQMQRADTFNPWMELLVGIVSVPVAMPQDQSDKDEWPDRPIWKCKKWAVQTMQNLFDRYGNPVKAEGSFRTFAKLFQSTWVEPLTRLILQQLHIYQQGNYLPPKVLALYLAFIATGTEHSIAWLQIKPHYMELLQTVLFPLMCFSEEDQELWDTDPYEFVSREFDHGQTLTDPASSALDLIYRLCKFRSKICFDSIVSFCHHVLTSEEFRENASAKSGALKMMTEVAPLLRKRTRYYDAVEPMLVTTVFPEFSSPYGFQRARAFRALHAFASGRFSEETVRAAVEGVFRGLGDKDLPVRIEAAVSLHFLSEKCESTLDYIKPHLKEVVMMLVQLLREAEKDDIIDTLRKLIEKNSEEMKMYAFDLAQQLVDVFLKLVTFDPEIEEEGHKALAALGCLNTMEDIVDIFEPETSALPAELEAQMIRIIHFVFENNVFDFFDEAEKLLEAGTCRTPISENMWAMLQLLKKNFHHGSIDFFPELTVSLYNFIRYGRETLMQQPALLDCVFDVSKQVWERSSDETTMWHAGKMMQLILLWCPAHIDAVVQACVGLAVTSLLKEGEDAVKTTDTRVMAMNVIIAAMYQHTSVVFATLQSVTTEGGDSLLARFFALWFSTITSFVGLHNRKLGIAALTRWMTVPLEQQPLAAQQAWPHLMAAALQLFSGLPAAYSQHALEEEDDDDDEEDNGDVDSEDDEEEHNVDDDENADHTDYQALLDGEVVSDEEEDECAFRGTYSNYDTPVDLDFDEYNSFKDAFDAIKSQAPQSFALLMSQVPPEGHEQLNEVFETARKFMEARISRQTEAAGGFIFDANAPVPSSFAFGQ
eukprot:m.190169 g.190169  ORF g.190169 m.190169 type:complete len:1034 (-) comp17559_c0_seq1:1718-4819(-)